MYYCITQVCLCLSDGNTQEGRKIRIPKNGTLDIYIAMDISGSISKEEFRKAKDAVTKLITKVKEQSHVSVYRLETYIERIKI